MAGHDTSLGVRYAVRRFLGAVVVLTAMLLPNAAAGAECWQGWGYFVEPKTLAFKSGQTLYVTAGPMSWNRREWVKLHPIDPKTGLRDPKRQPVLVRPSKPSTQGGGQWGDVVEDVADVRGSEWSMLLRLTHIKPSPHSMTLNDAFSRWACGLE